MFADFPLNAGIKRQTKWVGLMAYLVIIYGIYTPFDAMQIGCLNLQSQRACKVSAPVVVLSAVELDNRNCVLGFYNYHNMWCFKY